MTVDRPWISGVRTFAVIDAPAGPRLLALNAAVDHRRSQSRLLRHVDETRIEPQSRRLTARHRLHIAAGYALPPQRCCREVKP